MSKKRIWFGLLCLLAVVLTSVVTTMIVLENHYSEDNGEESLSLPTTFARNNEQIEKAIQTDFAYAAERSVHSVVHVKTKYKTATQSYSGGSIFDFFFGQPGFGMPEQGMQERISSGSGVILSSDGYIVTNNHVIDNASEVEVTLNDNRTFKAEIVGVDASTDIALLKIDADSLPVLSLGNSDLLKVGEWVLAVGNPFNLTSTVTAGIVSAKARNINILNSELKIESFIQTDAAVNPGNSGGALVNTDGELVGINTAIASQTGSYAGYSFAIPVSIVGKVVADLKEFGVVQRAVLGVQIRDITDEFAKEKKLNTLKGAYVASVVKGSSAEEAGVKEGDVIVAVNDAQVETSSQLQEQVGRYRPGDKVKIGYMRKATRHDVVVELKNRSGNTKVVKAVDLDVLGATLVPVSEAFKYKYKIAGGLLVENVKRDGRFAKSGIRKGFVILKVNNEYVYSLKDMEDALSKARSDEEQYQALFVSGIYPDGKIVHYAVDLVQN